MVQAKLLTKVYHKNLVKLVGYCNEENHLALVYEYIPDGNLKQHLSSSLLRWTDRIELALQTAQGFKIQ